MNIITKEIITKSSDLPETIVCLVAIGIMIVLMVHLYIKRNTDFVIKAMTWVFCIAMPLMLIGMLLGNTVFATPTDRYQYAATLNETFSAAELHKNYTNVEYKDGVWYFEDKEK